MERIFNWEQWRIIVISTVSPLLGYLTPTKGFVYALVVMFAFNIWAGMRADGVAIVRCKNIFVSEVQKRIVRIAFVSVYCGGDFCNNEKLRR